MKQLILVVLAFTLFCDSNNPVEPTVVDLVQFTISAGNQHILNEEFKIRNETSLIDIGKPPLTIKAEMGETIITSFEAHVTNFAINYPQCDCEQITSNYYKCTESRVVDGVDWEVAK